MWLAKLENQMDKGFDERLLLSSMDVELEQLRMPWSLVTKTLATPSLTLPEKRVA